MQVADTQEPGTAELTARWSRAAGDVDSPHEAALRALRASRESGEPLAAEARDLRGIRLLGEDLSGLDLSGVDLSGADLSRCDLRGARLMQTRLSGAVLYEADLTGCEFLSSDLSGADLTECRADRAGFGGADLSGATMFHASLEGSTLTNANLRGVDLRTANLRGARMREVDLTDADLTRADLERAGLEKSVVTRATFVHANLRHVSFRGLTGYDSARWIGADILDANFCGAYLARREIIDQNYLYEFRTKSRLAAGLYWVWWVTSDCGRSFVRWWLWTALLAAVFAGAYEFVAIDLGDHPTAFSSIYFSVVTMTTLGYGDVTPASVPAQLLAMAEVILGYVMLGGLLSIFANKMARRAD